MENLLVVEDTPEFQLLIKSALRQRYEVTIAGSVAEAQEQLKKRRFDLLILDVTLPDGDGFKLCASLRSQEKTKLTPVIFLTSRADLTDKLLGFSLGADDYIVKPFESLELQARVEAKIARQRERNRTEASVVRAELALDIPAQRAFHVEDVTHKRVNLELTPIEFKILYHLIRNEDRVISREQLLVAVWGEGTHVFDRATDKHVSSLRHKMRGMSEYIETVSGVGYRFAL